MKPITVDWREGASIHQIVEVLSSELPVIAFEFDRVFGLVAPLSNGGVLALNKVKQRLPGKTYGSILLSEEAFMSNSKLHISNPEVFFTSINNCFIRSQFRCTKNTSEVTSHQTHQTLLPDSALKTFFANLHKQIPSTTESYFEHPFPSFLVTSANTSGMPVITSLAEMNSFAHEKGIPIIVSTGLSGRITGSFPILDFSNEPYSISRHGIRDQELFELCLSHLKK